MKRLNFFFIFVAVIAGGFYLGSQASIPGHGLFMGKVGKLKKVDEEDRAPANQGSALKDAFEELDFDSEKGLWTLVTSAEKESICEAVEDVETYETTVQAAGVMESGEPVQIMITGDCRGNEKVVVFDNVICEKSLWNLGRGLEIGDGRSAISKNLLVPMKKMTFFMVSLKIIYKNGGVEELVETPPLQQKTLFSCSRAY